MKIRKRLLVTERRRRPPKSGWSWIDRRFLREHAPALERDPIFLYFFLVAVSDKDGISYWGDSAISARLRLEESALVRARDELERQDLIAYEEPLYQVLSLPRSARGCRALPRPQLLGDLLGEIARHAAPLERK